MAGRTVILLELDHLGLLEVLLEVEDVRDVGAAPRVNRLIVVAHNHEVLVLGGEQVGDLVLDMVGVLVLVDADVAEALLVLLEHLGAGAQQLERAHEQVVEIHGVRGAQAALQLQVHLGSLLLLRRARFLDELLRADHGVFGRGDLGADHVDGVLLLLDTQVGHDLAHHAAGIVIVVDGELAGIAEQVGVLAQHAHAHGMEGAHPHATHAAVGQHGAQTLAHLSSSLVGERDGENLPRANAQVADHAGDAERKHARLARPSAGEHEQRALGGEDRLALGGVERVDVDEGTRRGGSVRGLRVRRGGGDVRRDGGGSSDRDRGLIVHRDVVGGNLDMVGCRAIRVERHKVGLGGRGCHVPQIRLIGHALSKTHEGRRKAGLQLDLIQYTEACGHIRLGRADEPLLRKRDHERAICSPCKNAAYERFGFDLAISTIKSPGRKRAKSQLMHESFISCKNCQRNRS